MDFTPLAPKASASANFATPAYIFWSFDFARVRPEGDSPSPLVAPVALLGLGTSSLNFSTEKLSLPRPTVSSRARPLFESLQKQINLLLLAVSLRGPPRGIRTPDRLLKRQLLYQLSYGRIKHHHIIAKNKQKAKKISINSSYINTRCDRTWCLYSLNPKKLKNY